MTHVTMGTKRACSECGTKYYDLHRSPIICPRCGAVFVPSTSSSRATKLQKAERAHADDADDPQEFQSPGETFVPLSQLRKEQRSIGKKRPSLDESEAYEEEELFPEEFEASEQDEDFLEEDDPQEEEGVSFLEEDQS